MGFIQPCFIRKSTWHLVNMVYKIGGRGGSKLDLYLEGAMLLLVCERDQCRSLDLEFANASKLIERGYIDCGTNEELFLAIAALRDDTDKYQYFVNEKGMFVFCNQSELKHVIDNSEDWWDYSVSEFHKATVAELIEHFK